MKWQNFAGEFEAALNRAGYITTKTTTMDKLTPDEIKVVRAAVRGSIDLRSRYCKLQTEDPKMGRKKVLLRKELVHLKSALKKLK
jgi:hypothetical protein